MVTDWDDVFVDKLFPLCMTLRPRWFMNTTKYIRPSTFNALVEICAVFVSRMAIDRRLLCMKLKSLKRLPKTTAKA